jgi:hypothetical protein
MMPIGRHTRLSGRAVPGYFMIDRSHRSDPSSAIYKSK